MIKSTYLTAVDADVQIARRKGTRHLRLSVKTDGTIRLTVPYGASEQLALKFLNEKLDWIKKHRKQPLLLRDGDRIGKSHWLHFEQSTSSRPSTRVSANQAIVYYPAEMNIVDHAVQKAAQRITLRVLSTEAERLLPQRLNDLASQNRLNYTSVKVKKLKSRWGSCDSQGNIIFNVYLMQLEWRLIDYVILHELSHVEYQHHQAIFWEQMDILLPDWRERRKDLRSKPTGVIATNF